MKLAQKLGIKKGMRVLVDNAPEGYIELLKPLPKGAVVVTTGSGELAFLQLFLRNLQEPELLTPERPAASGKGLLWITYPKQSSGSESGLSRDVIRESLLRIGWRAVAIVAVDDTWAALRFRPIVA